jgi:hypothetical protein
MASSETARGAERRRDARVLPDQPLEVVAEAAGGGHHPLVGRLVDASPGGLAFLCEGGPTAQRDLVVRVRTLEGGERLGPTEVRVVRRQHVGADVLAHCAFVHGPLLDWLDGLQAPAELP